MSAAILTAIENSILNLANKYKLLTEDSNITYESMKNYEAELQNLISRYNEITGIKSYSTSQQIEETLSQMVQSYEDLLSKINNVGTGSGEASLTTEQLDLLQVVKDNKNNIENPPSSSASLTNEQLALLQVVEDNKNTIENPVVGSLPTDLVDDISLISPYTKKISESNIDELEFNNTLSSFVASSQLIDFSKDSQLNSISSSTGLLTPSTTYNSSDFIEVLPLTDYFFHGLLTCAFYNKQKEFIKRIYVDTSGETLTTLEDYYYVRVSYQYNSSTLPRLVSKGVSMPSDYEEVFKFSNELTFLNKVKDDQSNNFVFDISVPSDIFRFTETLPDYTGLQTVTHQSINSLFDTLVDNDYVTKETLLQDAYSNDVFLYRFTPKKSEIDKGEKRLKIFINCGLHGFEKVSSPAVFEMLKDMITKSDSVPFYDFLRNNVDFLIIPVANPSGWDDFTRTNRNGVDLNRQFPWNWKRITDTTSSTYSGTAPLTENEAINVHNILVDEKPDFAIDFHNFHLGSNIRASGGEYFAYFFSNGDSINQNIAQQLYSKMSREFRKDYPYVVQDDFIGKAVSSVPAGMFQDYAQHLGIKYSCTFEVCNRWVDDGGASSQVYNDDTMRCSIDLLANYIRLVCRNIEFN